MGSEVSVVNVTSLDEPVLSANSTYWLAASAATTTGQFQNIRWESAVSDTGPYASRENFGSWVLVSASSRQAAYRVSGTQKVSVEARSWGSIKELYGD